MRKNVPGSSRINMIKGLAYSPSAPCEWGINIWQRTCTASLAFQPPRLLSDRAANYGSIIIEVPDEGTIQFKGPKIICDETGTVKNANDLCVSSGDMDVKMGYIGVDPSDAARDIATDQMSAAAGSAQSGQEASNVLDGKADTLWHTKWSAGHGREKHWIQFELKDFYLIDGIRYQPRPSGGTNGIITV